VPDVAGEVSEFAAEHGYLALALLMMVSPPLPSELVLPLGGFQVSRGALLYPGAVAVATAGALVHALAIYWIARGGRGPLARRLEPSSRHAARLARLDAWFERRGSRVVLLGRMLSGVRWLVGVPAGMASMPLRRYVPLTAAGCTAWNGALIGAGWLAGDAYAAVGDSAELASGAVVAAALALLAARVWARRRAAAR
jgi:membrane protein DedA with SNARE-associated domain